MKVLYGTFDIASITFLIKRYTECGKIDNDINATTSFAEMKLGLKNKVNNKLLKTKIKRIAIIEIIINRNKNLLTMSVISFF